MLKVFTKFGPDDAGALISAEEFAAAEFEPPYRYERVKGRLVVMSPAGREHRRTSRIFRRKLSAYWDAHLDLVDDVDVEGWVTTSVDDERIPDICIYLAGANSSQDPPERVPDLVIEFVSESRADQERDYIHKRAEYHRIGVREYVIVDRFKRRVLVLTWQAGDYAERVLTPDDVYSSPLLPGLAISLAPVFAA